MSRFDVQTLVLAFEKRIAALEKNPPELVSTAVILRMLEVAIDEVIKEHFEHLIKNDMKELLHKEFSKIRSSYIKQSVKDILNDPDLKSSLEDRIKQRIIKSVGDHS